MCMAVNLVAIVLVGAMLFARLIGPALDADGQRPLDKEG